MHSVEDAVEFTSSTAYNDPYNRTLYVSFDHMIRSCPIEKNRVNRHSRNKITLKIENRNTLWTRVHKSRTTVLRSGDKTYVILRHSTLLRLIFKILKIKNK